MADLPPQSNSNDDSNVRPEGGSTSTPRWVWVFGVIFLVLVLLVVIMMRAGGHTPPIQTLERDMGVLMQSLRGSPVFSLVVLVTLGLFGLFGVMVIGGLLGLNEALQAMRHFGSLSHRIHDLTYSFLFGTAAAGMLAQLQTPSRNVASQLIALIPWVGFVLVYALASSLFILVRPPFVPIFGALALLAIILHPTGRDLFSSLSVSRMNRVMLALVIIVAVPLLAFAATNIGLQRTVSDDHAAMGHYGYMSTFSFTVIGVGLFASLRPVGWWLPAWVAGLLPALLGLASLVFPGVGSSLGLVWALATIVWGAIFVATAELTQDAESPTFTGRDIERGGQADGCPAPLSRARMGERAWDQRGRRPAGRHQHDRQRCRWWHWGPQPWAGADRWRIRVGHHRRRPGVRS